MSKEAIEHYEAALKEAFPSGATGNVFHHWNEARKALAEQPAQGCEFCSHPLYAGTKCKNCGREQPAQQDDWKDRLIAQYQETILWQAKRITELMEQPSQSSKPFDAHAAPGQSFDTNSRTPQQEPVAWGVDWGRAGDQSCVSIIKRLPDGGIEVLATEYGPPASKPWMGLTDEEKTEIRRKTYALPLILMEAIEAKLKEKNT